MNRTLNPVAPLELGVVCRARPQPDNTLDETLTVVGLRLSERLRRSLSTTNPSRAS